ncbi:hypothetical protein NXS98_08605 [Fontisphaera persica]|uniref:hypothetical protein n=1 Tax=Fontisphaera persica TaxID=2974023 RepID=UPI0024C07148|nr:hypothetical protein [Fontisphaera persica]WCJ61168.1 hypothetical protein NXS98_08605 [Fontisphaera persica]
MWLAFLNFNPGTGLMVGSLWVGVWLGWAAWATRWKAAPGAGVWKTARAFVTSGLLALAIHVVIVFDNFHHWSHEMARIAMELRTAEFLPRQTGGAIYLTYVFLALWVMEAGWSWLAFEAWQRRPRWLDGLVQAYLHLYGVVLILLLGGTAAHYIPPVIPGIFGVGVVAVLTWLWRRGRQAVMPAGTKAP